LINTLEESVLKRTCELEQANVELAEANRLVVHANKMQLQHFACMSHEIRTPLNCVIGMTSLLKESNLTPQQIEAVNMIVSSGDLLMAIINDVLDYSKFETEAVAVNMQFCNLQDTLSSVLHSIQAKALAAQSVRTIFDVSIPEQVRIDRRRLQQILFNLLGNAIKFSRADGVIKLSIEMISLPIDLKRAHVIVTKSDNDAKKKDSSNIDMSNSKVDSMPMEEAMVLRFIVEDNGEGIDEQDLKRIFQPFQQASSALENIYGGTGLGLSITQKIVTALGGIIRVESKKGEWSKFTVDIPCTDYPANVEETTKKVENYVVHVVGFDEIEKSVANRFLQAYGMKGRYFTSLSSMVDVYRSEPVRAEQIHISFVHEDCYDDHVMNSLPQSIVFTFGQKFSINDSKIAFHFGSLEQMLPSHFVNHLIRTVSGAQHHVRNVTLQNVDVSRIVAEGTTDNA
jgi:signal transduction histidine kinase